MDARAPGHHRVGLAPGERSSDAPWGEVLVDDKRGISDKILRGHYLRENGDEEVKVCGRINRFIKNVKKII